MTNRTRTGLVALSGIALAASLLHAQGRGGSEWTTSRFDAQRSGSIGSDPRISVDTMVKPGAFGPFTFLWKMKLEYEPGAPTALTPPVLLDRLIGFRGFKSIAFVGTASDTVHAIDVDFGTPLWKYHVNYSASPPPVAPYPGCPGGLTTPLSRPTAIAAPALGAGGAGGGRGGRSGSGVGEPGQGAATLATAGQNRGGGAANPARGTVPPGAPAGAVPGSAAAAAGNVPGGLPAAARAGGAGGRGGRGFTPGDDAAYVLGSDGYLRALNVQNGWDNMTPTMFLPANTRAAGLIIATTSDGVPTAYATTVNGCGSQPDGVWAMALGAGPKTVTSYQPKDARIAGSTGAAVGRDGVIYVATADGSGAMSNALIALEPHTLKVKASVPVAQAKFNSSPVVFQSGGKDIVAVAGGNKVYLFDSTALARGPIATSAAYSTAASEPGALTTWAGAQDARFIAVAAPRAIVVMKVTDQAGQMALQPGWTSGDIAAPQTPVVVNGVLFTASTGTRAVPGVLHAMDASTGKPLWNSARTITGIVQGGLSAGGGNVYVPTADSTLYAFGFAIEK